MWLLPSSVGHLKTPRDPHESVLFLVWWPGLLPSAPTEALGTPRLGQGEHFCALPGQRVDNQEASRPGLPSTQGSGCSAEQCVAMGTDI